jgi:glycerophosphoryl diester phosphodiesterase
MRKIVLIIVVLYSGIILAQTKVIAHRGFSEIAPENTLSAFQKAIEIGADYFEFDVHKTKDGILVIIHDKTVDRTSSNGKKGEISKLSFKEVQKIRVGSPSKFGNKFKDEKIPTLNEALRLAKGKIKVCVEIKADGIVKEVEKTIRDLDMEDEVIIFAFSDKSLSEIKKINPKLKTLLLRNYANLKTLDVVKGIHADAIGVGYDTKLTKEFITTAHNKDIKVFKWTVNKEGQMKYLIGIGVDGLITNHPDKALNILKLK